MSNDNRREIRTWAFCFLGGVVAAFVIAALAGCGTVRPLVRYEVYHTLTPAKVCPWDENYDVAYDAEEKDRPTSWQTFDEAWRELADRRTKGASHVVIRNLETGLTFRLLDGWTPFFDERRYTHPSGRHPTWDDPSVRAYVEETMEAK